MAITPSDFSKIWASNADTPEYTFTEADYLKGWDFVGNLPPTRAMWNVMQKSTDEKMKYVFDNFGAPLLANTVAEMTMQNRVYVYTGSETGYTAGHWYYWNGSAWTDGGVYNAAVVQTDATLTQAGVPADAKATGDAIALKPNVDPTLTISGAAADAQVTGDKFTAIEDIEYSDNLTDPSKVYGAVINNDTGAITANNYYCCSDKIPCTPGETLYIFHKNAYGLNSLRKTVNDKIAFYRADGTFISIGYNADSYTVPANASYCVLQGAKGLMQDGEEAVFRKNVEGTTNVTRVWIPYQKTITIKESSLPLNVQENADALQLSTDENLINPSDVNFIQIQAKRIATDRFFHVKPNRAYVLSYDGSQDDGTTIYINYYDADKQYLNTYNGFNHKYSVLNFVTPATAEYIQIHAFNNTAISPQTFTFSNPKLAYGQYPILGDASYRKMLSAESIPQMPDRLYVNAFSGMESLAHMGLSYYFPQNTIWSWLGAKKAGFDYIECDLQVTADNVIVLIHDPDMRRYGGTASQTVESLTYAQLQTFDAGAWFDPKYAGTAFPKFDDFVGIAKALGIKLALDCKTINTAERISAVATILRKWGMLDNVLWITGRFAMVWNEDPNAKIFWPAGSTLIHDNWEDVEDGWFASFTRGFPADKKVLNAEGKYVVADGVWFGITQSIAVVDDYGVESLQEEAELARKYNCKYGLYAVDGNDEIYNYIMSIPYLGLITSNRITPQAATCEKYGIGVSNRPQDI